MSQQTTLGLDRQLVAWLEEMSRGEQFDTPPSTLGDLVAAQVGRTPDAVAVVY